MDLSFQNSGSGGVQKASEDEAAANNADARLGAHGRQNSGLESNRGMRGNPEWRNPKGTPGLRLVLKRSLKKNSDLRRFSAKWKSANSELAARSSNKKGGVGKAGAGEVELGKLVLETVGKWVRMQRRGAMQDSLRAAGKCRSHSVTNARRRSEKARRRSRAATAADY